MDNVYFEYQKSSRFFALEMLSVAITFPASIFIALHFIPVSQSIEDYVKWSAAAIGILVSLFFALPNFKKASRFRFCVTETTVLCEDSTPNSLNYRVNIEDLKEIYIDISYGGHTSYWYYLITKDGQKLVIPNAYTLSPSKIVKVIHKHFPNISISRSKSY